MTRVRVCLLALAAVCSSPPLHAWDRQEQRLVNARAAARLQAPLQAFFEGNLPYLDEHAIDPDLWREAGSPGPGRTHDGDGTSEEYRALVVAFERRDPGEVLRRAAVLGRYVADAPARAGPRGADALSDPAEAVGRRWRSAWEEAGRPALDWSFQVPYVRGESRGVLITLDGAGALVIDDALRRGLMPNLGRLRRMGAAARGSQPPLPVKTAAAHAALFTGAWGDRSGITGNSVPRPGGRLGEWDSGFSSRDLRAEPIWATAARQGLDVMVVAATQNYPFEPFFEERRFAGSWRSRLTLLDGFQGRLAPDGVLRAADLVSRLRPAGEALPRHAGAVRSVAFQLAGVRIEGVLFDDPGDPHAGFDTLALVAGRSTTRLKPRATADDAEAFGELRLASPEGPLGVFLRLFALSPDGRELLLYHSAPSVLRGSSPDVQAAALEASGGFVRGTAGEVYARGELGPPLWEGGDGSAEARLLETVALCSRQFRLLTELALDRSAAKLVVTYLPVPDEFSHAWLGLLDPQLPGHDPALAARLRPYFDRGLALVDRHLGFLLDRLDARTFVAVGADHGQTTISRVLRPNVALRAAGLLILDEHGQVDVTRTRAVYFMGNSGYVLINRPSRGGSVTPEQEPEVRRLVTATLEALLDPRSGERLVPAVLDASLGSGPFGMGGPNGGDLYLSLAPGLDLDPEAQGALLENVRPIGTHMLDPDRPALWGTFQLAGAGVRAGADLGLIRHIDVAPTLCALLGIEAPAQAQGHVLEAALARGPASAPPASPRP